MGFSVQIVLGLSWMVCNMGAVQDFAEASAGIYGLAAGLLGKVYPVMYALQLFAACYAGQRLISRLCNKNPDNKRGRLSALWGSLALMTLPMAMQCHMALLPYSLVCSAGLLQLSFCCELLEPGAGLGNRKAVRNREPLGSGEVWGHKEAFGCAPFAGIWLCYLAQALLLPEYVFLGAVLMAVMLLLKIKDIARANMRLKIFMLAAAAAAAGIYASWSLHAEAGTENDISGIEWTMVKRICWPTLWVDFERMPDKIKEATADAVWESTYYPGNMDRVFKPAIEAAMSAGDAKPLLAEAAACSWDIHYPLIVRQVGWDVLGYCVSPVILQLQLSGDAYDSHSGRNYEIMRRSAPALTKQYVNYSSWWFAAAAVLTALLLAARLAAGERPYGKREGLLTAAALLSAACCVLWYTMQGAGIMDYKYTVLINQLWFLWSFKTSDVRREDGSQNEGEGRRA